MPELPDVEYFKRYIDATALHQIVERIAVGDDGLLKDVSARTLRRHVTGHAFRSSTRHGKYLFLEVEGEGWLVMHFGMTGTVRYGKRDKEPPGHAHVRFEFANGYRMVFECSRKLGYVTFTVNRETYLGDRDQGIDALDDGLDFDRFRERIGGRRGGIKATLMNQHILAGIGNVYSDEILFHAGVRPDRTVDELDDDALRAVYEAMREVLPTAADCHAAPDEMPPSFLTPDREEGAACPRCKTGLQKTTISGRTSYFCEQCQM